MQIMRTKNLNLYLFRPDIFKDYRGEYTEVYNTSFIDEMVKVPFIQDDAILSYRGVLRGYHGDYNTYKFVMCLQGAFQISIGDINPQSPTYQLEDTLILDDKERMMLLIPPKFVNAHQCLTDTCLFFYKQTTFYGGEKFAYTICHDNFGVHWPIKLILSERDTKRALPSLEYIDMVTNTLLKPEEVNQ